MTRIVRRREAAGVALALAMAASPLAAEVASNPYSGIVERNVFNLKPPPGPEDNLPPAQAPPKITLTGITTILGNKRALMKVLVPSTPPKPPSEESYILTEGQRDGEIEVMAIDEQAGSVRVNNHGVIQELTFDKDGAKLPAHPLPSTAPPALPKFAAQFPAQARPQGPATTFHPPAPLRPNPGPRSMLPSRTLRLPPRSP